MNNFFNLSDNNQLVKLDDVLLVRTFYTSITSETFDGFRYWSIETLQCRESINLYVSYTLDVTAKIGELSLLDTVIADARANLLSEARATIQERLTNEWSREKMLRHIEDSKAIEGITIL